MYSLLSRLLVSLNYSHFIIVIFFDPEQGSRSPDFGAEIRPHSQCQKVCFFPNSRQKIPNFTKKKKNFFFFFGFSTFHFI